jgi:hypothetical protein
MLIFFCQLKIFITNQYFEPRQTIKNKEYYFQKKKKLYIYIFYTETKGLTESL